MEVTVLDELRSALELATEDELKQLTQILFCRKFNPLDYLQTPRPIEVQSQDWQTWLDSLEERFRYLAADGLTVIKGKSQEFSYRQALIRVCQYLKIPYAQQMATTEIEAEIFLHLVNQAWKKLPKTEQKSLIIRIQKSLDRCPLPEALPVQLQHNPVDLLLKGSGAIAVSAVLRPLLLKRILQEFTLHLAQYQAAQFALVRGGALAASQVQSQLTLQTARQGMAMTAARYGAVKTVFSFLGPALWGWFLADLGWRAITTNYGRIIPVIVSLAQIRLTRAEAWQLA
ncbi:YaaW family protein [Synechocystis sp. LKSZ1]|uniref:YaaW family protein n=1 Tax=Synechocystis sp. LKSZ1 TaxID=3144951 RepID=UPI00336BB81F